MDCATPWGEYMDPTTSPARKDEILLSMLQDYDIVFDIPCYHFWKEIMNVFPEAKCIFWQRDEDSWWKSFRNQIDSLRTVIQGPDFIRKPMGQLICPRLIGVFEKFNKGVDPMIYGHNVTYRDWRGNWLKLE